MLINLTITSLLTSSLASSPLFSTNVQYKLELCQFNKIFPIVFYQTPKLNVYKTYFTKLQSELIMVNSKDFIHNFTNNDLGSNFQYNEDVNFLQCRFWGVDKTGSAVSNIYLSFTDCLFYIIKSSEITNLFTAQSSNQISITGCCFSEVSLNSVFLKLEQCGSIFLESNIFVSSELSNFISITGCQNFRCRYCNITSNKFQDVFHIMNSPNTVLDSTQFNNNALLCLIYNTNSIGEINISSIFSINNVFGLSSNYGPDFPSQATAILYIYCKTIFLTNSFFLTNQTTISLFSPLSSPLTKSYVTIVNNSFTYSLNNKFEYQGVSSSFYSNNNALHNNNVPTTPVTVNPYLYYHYREECKIYLHPTTPFTESSVFTPSSDFTPSSHFTASSIFSPSSTFSASSKFTSSATFTVPTASPSVNATYGIVGAFGTAIVSFGIASLIWLSIRRFCIYDHNNYLHMDV